MAEVYAQMGRQIALKYGTPQAQVNAQNLAATAALANGKLMTEGAVDLAALPGPHGGSGAVAQAPGGEPSSGVSHAPGAQEEYDNNHIMVPGASLDKVRYTPKLKDQLPELTSQFTQAKQAEKALQSLNEIFPKMRAESTKSGWLASHINPNAIGAAAAGVGAIAGGIGGGLLSAPLGGAGGIPGAALGATEAGIAGKGLGEAAKAALAIPGGQQQVQFDDDKKALAKIVAGAAAQAKLTPTEIEDMVERLTPSYSDSQATYENKLSIIRKFIRQNTPTSLLEDPQVALVKGRST